jgi:hypothetical protein
MLTYYAYSAFHIDVNLMIYKILQLGYVWHELLTRSTDHVIFQKTHKEY